MALIKVRRPRPPLSEAALQELALRYVGKYATTRAKLRAYLARKVRERGWEGTGEPQLEALAERFAQLGYIDDASYALSKSRALGARGYGKRRLAEKLRAAGVSEQDGRAALESAGQEKLEAALNFARRRRFGPFSTQPADRPQLHKWIASMVRAGHDFDVASAIARMKPNQIVDIDQFQGFGDAED